jgi:hypothetical protein
LNLHLSVENQKIRPCKYGAGLVNNIETIRPMLSIRILTFGVQLYLNPDIRRDS